MLFFRLLPVLSELTNIRKKKKNVSINHNRVYLSSLKLQSGIQFGCFCALNSQPSRSHYRGSKNEKRKQKKKRNKRNETNYRRGGRPLNFSPFRCLFGWSVGVIVFRFVWCVVVVFTSPFFSLSKSFISSFEHSSAVQNQR